MEIMYSWRTNNSYFNNKNFIAFKGERSDLEVVVNNLEELKVKPHKKVKSFIGKSQDYLKALGMPETILKTKMGDLASTDLKLIMLVKAITLRPEMIILNNFELGINDRITNRIARFLKTINGAFNIKFMVISRDPLFIGKVAKDILVMNQGIVKYQGDLMLAMKQNMIAKPEIIKCIDMIMEKKKKTEIEYTLDDKELLKAIYRSVS